MERFIALENIKRYRRLLDFASDEIQRRQIMNLLVDEEERAKELESLEPLWGQDERPGESVSGH
jgi:bacterioferritin (cytochrome b1)